MSTPSQFTSFFQSADDATQDAILRTAILRQFTVPELTRVVRVQPTIDPVTLLQDYLKGDSPYYLPGDIREYLCEQFQQRDPVRYQDLHRAAAMFYREAGQGERAIAHHLAVGDVTPAVEIAEKIVHPLLVGERHTDVLDLHAQLQTCDAHMPNVYLAAAIVLMHQLRFAEAYRALVKAESQFQYVNDDDGVVAVQAQIATIHLEGGDYQRALQQAEDALRRLAQTKTLNAMVQGMLLRVKALALSYLGQHPEATAAIKDAITSYKIDSDGNAHSIIYQDAVIVFGRAGERALADDAAVKFIERSRKLGDGLRLAYAHNSMGVLYHEQGAYDNALYNYGMGLDQLNAVDDARARAYLLFGVGDVKRDTWRYAEAEDCYVQCLQHIGNDDPFLRCQVHWGLSKLNRWQGNTKRALNHARDALFIAEQHNMAPEIALSHAMIDIVTDDNPTAYLQALASYESDATQYIAAEVLHMEWAYDGPVDIQQQIDALLVYRYQAASPPTVGGDVRVQALGNQSVQINGQVVQRTAYRYDTKALEFFFYVLFNWPVTKQQIINQLFPQQQRGKVDNQFSLARQRARKIAPGLIVHVNDAYQIHEGGRVLDIDYYRFTEYLREAERLSAKQALKADRLRAAIRLYGGDFLPQVDSTWARDLRRQLKADYGQALIDLSDCVAYHGNYAEAANLAEQAIAVNPFDEAYYRKKMCHLHADNNRTALAQFFDEMLAFFERELGTPPSKATWDLWYRLSGDDGGATH